MNIPLEEVSEMDEMDMSIPVPVKEVSAEHKHNYVPLYMSVVVFALIVVSYICCAVMGLEVNLYREMASILISGIGVLLCMRLNK